MNEAASLARAGPEAPPAARQSIHWLLFIALGAGVAALDLWTKQWVFNLLQAQVQPVLLQGVERQMVVSQKPVVLIPGLFELEANVNYGAFSGWFAEHTGFLTILSAAALLVIAGFLWSHLKAPGPHRFWFTAALGLLCGGTLGNLYDRAVHGFVRDFVKWFLVWDGKPHVWPNFNIADSAICVGVGIIFVLILVDSGRRKVQPQRL
jgi:signal peptidase II